MQGNTGIPKRKEKPQAQFPEITEELVGTARRASFLRYLNWGWLLFGIVTLAAMPFFPAQHDELVFVAAVALPTYLITWVLLFFGRPRLAGLFFTLMVDAGFYGLFLYLTRLMGAERAFETQVQVWMLMGLAVLFAGAFVDKWAAPVLALVNTVLLIVTHMTLAPNSDPRPGVAVFGWILALAIWLYERTLEQVFTRLMDELVERIRVEAELRRLHSEMEERVAERTSRLAARESFLSGIFNTAGDAIITVDETQQILSVSQSAEEIFGYRSNEIIGQPLDLLLPPQSIPVHRQHIDEFRTSSESTRIMGLRRDVYGCRKDGTIFPVEASISKLILDDKLTFTAFLRDITDRQNLEKALSEQEQRFRRVFEVSPVSIVVTTLDEGRLIEANDAFWKLSGHDPNTSMGKSTLELRTGYDVEKRQAFIHTLVEKRSIKDSNYMFVDDAGHPHHVLAFYELIELDGQPTILSMFSDLTEQDEVQNALRASEMRVRGLLNAIPDEIFELQRDGLVLQYIPPDEESSHGPSEHFLGRSIDEIMPASVAAQIKFAAERALESGQIHIIEYEIMLAGSEKIYEARVSVSGKDSVLIIVRDVSFYKWLEIERETMIEELEKRNAESESLRETTVIVTSTLDVSEAVQRILQQLKRVITYDSASVWLYKDNMAHLVGGDGVPDMPEQDKHFKPDETEPDYALWAENRPYVLLEDVQENYPQFRQPPINYIHGWLGVPLKVRGKLIGIISLDSRSAGRFTNDDAQLTLNYANQVSIALENAQLFSELNRELKERQKLIDELDAKNSELERFTYAVSHDLKSPLITVKGFLGLLKADMAAGNAPRVQNDIQRMAGAMDVMQERLDDLLELLRAGRVSDQLEIIPFNDLVAEALELVHGRLSQRGIRVRVDENLPSVTGNRRRLLEMMQNLMDNASKFMGDQTDPLIEICHGGDENGMPIFLVRDNGIGIPPEQHETIFGIFNKLNPKAEGTGIGLALVKKIIEIHGGRIWVESEAEKGSAFYFSLPRG